MRWGSSLFLILLICIQYLIGLPVFAQAKLTLKNGDLLFLDLDCGPLCDAIEAVTPAYNGLKYSHVGIVFFRKDSCFLIEAKGKKVQMTFLKRFLQYSTKPALLARISDPYPAFIAKAISFAQGQIGMPYDDVFLVDNGKYYCSELLFDAFKAANDGLPYFKLEPMTFCIPGSKEFFPAWVEYYQNLGMEIPEGKPGINPGGMLEGDKLSVLGFIKP